MARKNTSESKEVKDKSLIYCGPSLPKGVLLQFTVYQNGIPKHLGEQLEKCKVLNKLFVPIEEFSKTMSAISKQGSPQNIWFEQIKNTFYGGAK